MKNENKGQGTAANPDILEVVYWLQQIEDPVEQLRQGTTYADKARDELLPELAAVRRIGAVKARKALMQQGLSATEATRKLAELAGQSPQTIMRLIAERGQYGG